MAFLQVNFMSKSLMRTVTVNAIVPVDKLAMPGMPVREKKPFKTLYLLHGIFGNYTDWVNGTRLQAWAEERNLAVIMPSGENRFYLDNEAVGEMFGEFIGHELVDVTRDLFPLSTKRDDTFIAGLSMGGYGAIRNGLKYSEMFGSVAGLSAALILEMALSADNSSPLPQFRRRFFETVFGDLSKLPGSDKDPRALIDKLIADQKPIPELYICCGTEDMLINQNREYHAHLEKSGVKHTYVEGPGNHDWVFWDEYILKVLEWLPLEGKAAGVSSGNVL